jgi:hypothetical protein
VRFNQQIQRSSGEHPLWFFDSLFRKEIIMSSEPLPTEAMAGFLDHLIQRGINHLADNSDKAVTIIDYIRLSQLHLAGKSHTEPKTEVIWMDELQDAP